jgi:hypothetical protein
MYSMVQNYHYTVSDLENMIPFERDLYIAMIQRDNDAKEDEAQQQGT